MTSNRLCILVALWIVATANHSFWALLFTVNGTGIQTWLFVASVAVAMTALNTLVLRLLSPEPLIRIMLSILLVIAAATSWFMDTYGVSIDIDMVRNLVQTNPAEAMDFVGWPLLWRMLWQAGLPILMVWQVPLRASTWTQASLQYVTCAALCLVVFVAVSLPMYASYASFFRNQRSAEQLLAPGNVIRAATKLVLRNQHANKPFRVVGADAHRLRLVSHGKPLLTVLIVGETARAANFSLGGYARATNPELAKRNVLYFNNVHSCGTATAISVPCMFSELPRDEFDLGAAAHRDTVLDILQRAGLSVSWVDNQDGCKGVCARIPNEQAVATNALPCDSHDCLDEVLLHALDKKLANLTTDSVLVLHQIGSHGPTYFRRVPDEYVIFKPTCPTQLIETCTKQQIVNAYDNSIAYTDHVLAALIDRLKQHQNRLDSVLLYVSDHGESLGEKGLYLHGEPYLIAPDFQKHVPMLMWFSAATPTRLGLDLTCMRNTLSLPLSHDYLSHTLLGLNAVRTTAYRPRLDMLNGCRSVAAIAAS